MKRILNERILKESLPVFLILLFLISCCSSPPDFPADPMAGIVPVDKEMDYSDNTGNTDYDGGIVFYGDTGKHHDVHMDMVKRVFAFDPVAVVHLGDAVRDGSSTVEWEYFDTITQILREKIPFYPVIGNHEKGIDIPWYLNHWGFSIGMGYYSLDLMTDGEIVRVPVTGSGESDYTGIDQDSTLAHIVVLHSNPTFFEEGNDQYNWLINDLEQYDGIPVILTYHIPLHSAGIHSEEMYEEHPARDLYDIVADESYNIVACVSGHDHAYERFEYPDGVQHIVTGCAGESPKEIQVPDHPYLELYEPVHHLSVLNSVTDEDTGVIRLRFTAFDIDFNIIDSVEIDL